MLDRSLKPLCSYEIVTNIRNVSKPFTKKQGFCLMETLTDPLRRQQLRSAFKCVQIAER